MLIYKRSTKLLDSDGFLFVYLIVGLTLLGIFPDRIDKQPLKSNQSLVTPLLKKEDQIHEIIGKIA